MAYGKYIVNIEKKMSPIVLVNSSVRLQFAFIYTTHSKTEN